MHHCHACKKGERKENKKEPLICTSDSRSGVFYMQLVT
jgi:hypothetical protein